MTHHTTANKTLQAGSAEEGRKGSDLPVNVHNAPHSYHARVNARGNSVPQGNQTGGNTTRRLATRLTRNHHNLNTTTTPTRQNGGEIPSCHKSPTKIRRNPDVPKAAQEKDDDDVPSPKRESSTDRRPPHRRLLPPRRNQQKRRLATATFSVPTSREQTEKACYHSGCHSKYITLY